MIEYGEEEIETGFGKRGYRLCYPGSTTYMEYKQRWLVRMMNNGLIRDQIVQWFVKRSGSCLSLLS